MNLNISNTILDIVKDFNVIAYDIEFIDTYNALTKSTNVDLILNDIYQKYPKKFEYDTITKIPKLKNTRDGYKALGKDPSHTRPAPEALLRRVVRQNKLYRLGDVIDLGNILSLYTLRSVCVVDYDKLVGDVEIKLGTTLDNYEGINRVIINVSNIPIYTDSLGAFGCPTSDTIRTMVTKDTKRILIMIICFDSSLMNEDEQTLKELYLNNTQVKKITKIK